MHSALAHGAALPPTPWAASNADETGRGYGSCNAAGCVDGSEDASSLRLNTRLSCVYCFYTGLVLGHDQGAETELSDAQIAATGPTRQRKA